MNGLAGDRSATSYRLRDGDVAWWDYRDWSSDAATLEVVAGAFPEPFVHGFDGKRGLRRCATPAAFAQAPSRSRAKLGTDDVAAVGTAVPADANLFELVNGAPHLTAAMRSPGSGPSGAVRFSFAGSVQQLLDG